MMDLFLLGNLGLWNLWADTKIVPCVQINAASLG